MVIRARDRMPVGRCQRRGRQSEAALFRYLRALILGVDTVWFISCNKRGMFKCSSHTRLGRISGFTARMYSWGRAVLLLLMIQHLPASDLSLRSQSRPESVAFARYIASLEQPDPFTEGVPVAVLIESSLPHLYKDAELLAIRNTGENERSEYVILGIVGDGAAVGEVTTRYFALQKEIEDLPLSSIQISPENYTFRLLGEVKTGIGSAYVYDITPRKRRAGLFKGQIWIEAGTGAEVLVTGRLADPPSIGGSVDFVRETKLDGASYARVTHLSFAVPLLGRGELVVTERPLGSQDDIQLPQGSSKRESITLDLPDVGCHSGRNMDRAPLADKSSGGVHIPCATKLSLNRSASSPF